MGYKREWSAAGDEVAVAIPPDPMKRLILQTACLLLAGMFAAAAVPEDGKFSTEQLDQLVAPIALYPDDLLSQTMMAATYPLEIVQASRWRGKNEGLSGAALDRAMESQPWEPSVKSLVAFPETLALLNDNLDWTQDLGDAVLGQQDDVMRAVQRMRDRARAQGNLATTTQQTVVIEKETIIIRPASTQVVYVPVYNPVVIYGPAWRPVHWYYPCYGYPPSYWYRGRPISNALSFTAGVAVGGILFGGCDWQDRRFYVRPAAYTHPWYRGYNGITINSTRNVTWTHNPVHRNGVHYHNQTVTNQYIRPGTGQTITRPGYDRPVTRPAVPNRPSVDRPVTLPATRPANRPTTLPADLTRPAIKPSPQPVARPMPAPGANRPSVDRPATLPATRPANRPTTLPADLTRPATKPSPQPVARPMPAPGANRPVTRPAPSSSGGAFKGTQSASGSRAASARGAKSAGGRPVRR